MILRRIGPGPHAEGAKSPGLHGCPEIFELENGDFAVIGKDITAEAAPHLPPDASCGPDERIVVLPRKTFLLAKPHLPS